MPGVHAIGSLRCRGTLEQATVGQDARGGPTETWSVFATIWFGFLERGGTEFTSAQRRVAQMTDLLVAHYRDGIEPTMRLWFEGRYLEVLAAYDPDKRRREILIAVREID